MPEVRLVSVVDCMPTRCDRVIYNHEGRVEGEELEQLVGDGVDERMQGRTNRRRNRPFPRLVPVSEDHLVCDLNALPVLVGREVAPHVKLDYENPQEIH